MDSLLLFLGVSVWETLWAKEGGNNILGVTDEDQWANIQGFGVFGDIQRLCFCTDGCYSTYHLRLQCIVLRRQRKQFRVKIA